MESLYHRPVKYYTEIPAIPDGNPPDNPKFIHVLVVMLKINIQFINSLRSEWRRFASNIQQNCDRDDLDIHELFELLNHNQDEVLEILGTGKKADKCEDGYDIPSDVAEKGTESDEEMNGMKKVLALITRSMTKRNARMPMTSNSHCYISGGRYQTRDHYDSRDRNDTRRYDEQRRYDDQRRYKNPAEPRRFEQGGRADYHKLEEKAKPEDKGKEVKKEDAGPMCFKSGKLGHFARNCTNHCSSRFKF
ncbi:hypothetical protein OSB04_016905 [Centaurea solstitialis]|uniref:CCHC-type domain-containing protein n=1 Tax=Centaurea solstitialis TaxID=347529 RepID=A0AA38WHW8_9ASTR|nr:hypothetical protein OSB04_016905 [Centaurea solstitialis]